LRDLTALSRWSAAAACCLAWWRSTVSGALRRRDSRWRPSV